jgi:hypothetical protein
MGFYSRKLLQVFNGVFYGWLSSVKHFVQGFYVIL